MPYIGTVAVAAAPPVGPAIIARRALFGRLERAGRVAHVSAPAGSGKTSLVASWIHEAGLADSAAWVSVQSGESDGQRFWLSVLDALRDTAAGSTLVRAVSATPGLDIGEVVERLLEDLASLEERVWLVIDDLHELRSADALRQLELLLMRAPAELRVVLVTRHDVRLGLHRLRLEGGVTEIRAEELRFTRDQARQLLETAGVELSDSALARLHEHTEGWAAGLRLAALSLAGHPDPERFQAEFSGGERTVSEYLLAEVLERQPHEVRRLLLRTSVLERVSGPLADQLTGRSGGERILQELEQANAFVVSLDPGRSWFRYHRLFVDLLKLELRRTDPSALPALHRAAADWFAAHDQPLEAIRQAQAAEEWDLGTRLLSESWISLLLDGQVDTLGQLLAGFPARVIAVHPELVVTRAGTELVRGSLDEAERLAGLAARDAISVPAERRERFDIHVAVLRLGIARRRGNLPAAVEEAQRLLPPAEAPDAGQLGVDEELRAMALLELGVAELWSGRAEQMDLHLERSIASARRMQRPALEISGLAHWALAALRSSYALAMKRANEAIELARRHGWSEEPMVAAAYLVLGNVSVWQGRLEAAESWLALAERARRTEIQPASELLLQQNRGLLALVRGRDTAALEAFQAAERQAELLVKPHPAVTRMHALRLGALLQTGRIARVESALGEMNDDELKAGEIRITVAALRLAQGDAEAAATEIAPVLDGSAPVSLRLWLIRAHLQEASARDALGDAAASHRALERALDLAEPDGVLLWFLLGGAPGLLERHTGSSHGSMISDIRDLLAGRMPLSAPGEGEWLIEPLTESETRVLRYLPTNLSLGDIGNELYVTLHTVRTHTKHLYTKLAVHSRGDAVQRARALGLLAPSSRTR